MIYLRSVDKQERVHCSFVISRSRITPIRLITVPRLELVAAVACVELASLMCRELRLSQEPCTFWTDSTAVLQYVRGTARRYKTFVENRIALIQSSSLPSQWRHVGTKFNPANLASRGVDPRSLISCHEWFEGPQFLWLQYSAWPKDPPGLVTLDAQDPELCSINHVAKVSREEINYPMARLLEHYSCFVRLRNAVAWLRHCKRLLLSKVKNVKTFSVPTKCILTTVDLEGATTDIIKLMDKIAKLKEDFKQKYDKTKNSNKKMINGNIRDKDNWVVNLSNKNLSEDEREVLLLGLNFLVSQDYIPKTEILANIEKGLKNLPDNTSSIIRSKVVNILNKKHKSFPNLSIKEKKALKNLRDDTNIVITKADKGNCTVIINKDK